MNKISWFAAIFAVVLVLSACGLGSDESEADGSTDDGEVSEWKLGHLSDARHSWHDTSLKFADLVKEKTDVAIEITVYPRNTLGGGTDTTNAIQAGTADLVISGET